MNPDFVDRMENLESLTRGPLYSLAIEARDEIIQLQFEVSRLRAHLADIAEIVGLRDREVWDRHHAEVSRKMLEGIE
jgi:hypothetical protein